MEVVEGETLEQDSSNSSVITPGCIVSSSGDINCRNAVYTDPKVWRANRENVDEQIRNLRLQLEGLKVKTQTPS